MPLSDKIHLEQDLVNASQLYVAISDKLSSLANQFGFTLPFDQGDAVVQVAQIGFATRQGQSKTQSHNVYSNVLIGKDRKLDDNGVNLIVWPAKLVETLAAQLNTAKSHLEDLIEDLSRQSSKSKYLLNIALVNDVYRLTGVGDQNEVGDAGGAKSKSINLSISAPLSPSCLSTRSTRMPIRLLILLTLLRLMTMMGRG
jgi:hypothetical protein